MTCLLCTKIFVVMILLGLSRRISSHVCLMTRHLRMPMPVSIGRGGAGAGRGAQSNRVRGQIGRHQETQDNVRTAMVPACHQANA